MSYDTERALSKENEYLRKQNSKLRSKVATLDKTLSDIRALTLDGQGIIKDASLGKLPTRPFEMR